MADAYISTDRRRVLLICVGLMQQSQAMLTIINIFQSRSNSTCPVLSVVGHSWRLDYWMINFPVWWTMIRGSTDKQSIDGSLKFLLATVNSRSRSLYVVVNPSVCRTSRALLSRLKFSVMFSEITQCNVPKSVTLHDLERRYGRYIAL